MGPVTLPSQTWRHPDLRHFAVLLLGAVAGGCGPLAAGASAVVVLAFAAGGLVLLGLPLVLVLQPWRDPKWGSWVGGVMFLALSIVAVTVAEVIRLH
jgi:hypothetical protein